MATPDQLKAFIAALLNIRIDRAELLAALSAMIDSQAGDTAALQDLLNGLTLFDQTQGTGGVHSFDGRMGDVRRKPTRNNRDLDPFDFPASNPQKATFPLIGDVSTFGLFQASGRCFIPNTQGSTANAEINARTWHIAAVDIINPQFIVGNFRQSNASGQNKDTTLTSDATWGLGVEYPAGTMTLVPWDAMGAATVTILANEITPYRLSWPARLQIPKGQLFRVFTWRLSTVAGLYYNHSGVRNTAMGDEFEVGTSGSLGNKSMGGAVAAPNGSTQNNILPPIAIVSRHRTASVEILGGGNAFGVGETVPNASGAAGLARFIASAGLPWANYGATAESFYSLADTAGSTSPARFRAALAKYFSDAYFCSIGLQDKAATNPTTGVGYTPAETVASAQYAFNLFNKLGGATRCWVTPHVPQIAARASTADPQVEGPNADWINQLNALLRSIPAGSLAGPAGQAFVGAYGCSDVVDPIGANNAGVLTRGGKFYQAGTDVDITGSLVTSAGCDKIVASSQANPSRLTATAFNR